MWLIAESEPNLFISRTKIDYVVKLLGLCWKPSKDELGFHVISIQIRHGYEEDTAVRFEKFFLYFGFLEPSVN